MLTIRYNFETNSSSMHSLAIRHNDTDGNIDTANRCSLDSEQRYDAILVVKDKAAMEQANKQLEYKLYDNTFHIWKHDVDFYRHPMSLLVTFKDKWYFAYAEATGKRRRGWEKRVEALYDCLYRYYGKDLVVSNCLGRYEEYEQYNVNSHLVFQFVKQQEIDLYEFLSNPQYVIVNDYEEFINMQWLDMVDMNQVEKVFTDAPQGEKVEPAKLDIQDGLWMLTIEGLRFGRSPYRVLGTPESKARYALACVASWQEDKRTEYQNQALTAIQKVYPAIKGFSFPVYHWSWSKTDEIEYGYAESNLIDDIGIENFILNNQYVVIIDGDEYCIWDDFKKTPLFKRKSYPDETIYADVYDCD